MKSILKNIFTEKSMFHVKHINIVNLLFGIFLFTVPFNTRIIYLPELAYIGSFFSYHLAYQVFLSDLLLIVLLLSWIILEKPKFEKWLQIALISLCLLGVFWMFHVEHKGLLLYSLFKLVELMFLGWFIYSKFNHKLLKLTFLVLFTSSLIQGAVAVTQFHVQHDLGLSFLGEHIGPPNQAGVSTIDTSEGKLIRGYGTFPHPNILSAFLLCGLVIGFYYVSRETLWNKLLVSCGTVVIILGLFCSFSRISWFVAVLITCVFLFYLLWKKRYQSLLWIVMIIIVSCGTIWLTYGKVLQSRVNELSQQSNSVVLRESFNASGIQIFKQEPIFGIGLGNYIPVMQRMFHVEPWQYQPAHNIFIFVLAETGLIGFGLLIMFLYNAFCSTWNKRSQPQIFILLIIGISFILVSLFDHYFVTIQQGRLLFVTIFSLMLSTKQLQPNDSQD